MCFYVSIFIFSITTLLKVRIYVKINTFLLWNTGIRLPRFFLSQLCPMKRTHSWILKPERRVWTSNIGCAQSNSCSSSWSQGPDEWIFFLCAVGTLPVQTSAKLFQCFVSLWPAPYSSCKFPVGHLVQPLDETLHVCDCVWWTGERSTGGWCYFYPSCSQNSSPGQAGHTHPSSCRAARQSGG